VLDVGTGFGYRAAVTAALSARVVTVGSDPALAGRARKALRHAGIVNAEVVVEDAPAIASERGPFDAILLATAGSKERGQRSSPSSSRARWPSAGA
jgi:protein-L-isoaspartate(D-aspartate) O-methyltransferase